MNIKPAIGNYVLVRAITKDEAIALSKELFSTEGAKLWAESEKLWAEGAKLRAEGAKLWAEGAKLRTEGDKLRAEGAKLWAEGAKLRAEGAKLRAEGDKLWAEGAKLWAEGDKLRAEMAIQQCAFIPDNRAMNFTAADREDGVYCFVWPRKQIWFYDGDNCPNPKTVEVVWMENPR